MDEGTAQQSEAADAATPLYFGEYEVLKSIGKGKFAIVYRARKIGDDQPVALKRIAVDMMNEKARDKCLKEVRLLQSLDHPNIIHYMDSFITENDLVIVYEWAAAGDLKRQLRKAQERGTGFEERVIWKYFSQICNAMKHMHDKRIMHRDLKPANIFLTLDGTIKVGDLGLSRELSEHTIQAHSKVGTPLYMSPEVLKGEGYDFKSDIWSLGCLLYELAMLKSPFKSEGLNLYSLFQKISNGDYQPLPEHYSEQLRTLTYAMISTLPQDRPEIGYVCSVAQEMRALTAAERDKGRSSRKGSASAAGAAQQSQAGAKDEAAPHHQTASRPNSGLLSRPQTEGGAKAESEQPFPAAETVTRHQGRGSGFHELGTVEREGSFKLERVDSGWDGEGDGDDTGQRQGKRRSKSHARQRSGLGSTGGSGGGGARNPRDAVIDDKQEQDEDEDEDEATVGLGQAPFHDHNHDQGAGRPGGVAVLGSDSSPGRNRPRPAAPQDLRQDQRQHPLEHAASELQTSPLEPRRTEEEGRILASEITPSSKSDHRDQQPPPSSTSTGHPTAGNPYRRSKEQQAPRPASGSRAGGQGAGIGSQQGGQGQRDKEEERYSPAGNGSGKAPRGYSRSGLAGDRPIRAGSDQRSPLRVQGKTLEEHLEGSSTAFAVMEAAYCKLLLLGCPLDDPGVSKEYRSRGAQGRGRLLPFHFACDLQVFPQVAGHSAGHPFMQFRRFAQVAAWLCGRIGGAAAEAVARIDLEQDMPVMTAKQLLRATQAACGERERLPAELVDVSPTSLTPGFGENVCNMVLYLADVALQKSGFVPEATRPRGSGQGGAGESADDGLFVVVGGEEGDSEMEDEAEAVRSDDEGARAAGGRGASLRSHPESGESSVSLEDSGNDGGPRPSLGSSMMVGTIDPVLWKAETERVAAKLAAASTRVGGAHLSSEWADHVQTLRQYRSLHTPSSTATSTRDSEGAAAVGGPSGSSHRREGTASSSVLTGQLHRMRTDISNCQSRIRTLEKLLNRTGEVPAATLTYTTYKSELAEKEAAIEDAGKRMAQSSERLSALQDQCEELAEALRARSGGSGEGEDAGGGGAVVARLKQALFTIKADIRSMGTSTALVSAQVLAVRKEQAVARHNSSRSAAASRRSTAARKDDLNLLGADVFD